MALLEEKKPMFSFLAGWRRCWRPKDGGVAAEADALVNAFGVHAYEEARRRRFAADDLATAQYWSRVKGEIGRRLLDQCDGGAKIDELQARLLSIWDESRPRADELDVAIALSLGNDFGGPALPGAGLSEGGPSAARFPVAPAVQVKTAKLKLEGLIGGKDRGRRKRGRGLAAQSGAG